MKKILIFSLMVAISNLQAFELPSDFFEQERALPQPGKKVSVKNPLTLPQQVIQEKPVEEENFLRSQVEELATPSKVGQKRAREEEASNEPAPKKTKASPIINFFNIPINVQEQELLTSIYIPSHTLRKRIIFSPDSNFLVVFDPYVSNGRINKIHLIPLKLFKLINVEQTKGLINSVAFSPDSTQVAISENTSEIYLYDIAQESMNKTILLGGSNINTKAVAWQGDYIAIMSDAGIMRLYDTKLYDNKTREIVKLRTGRQPGTITVFTFSDDGKWIVSASSDPVAMLWNIDGTWQRLIGHTLGINAAVISPDSSFVVTGSKDSTARKWYTQNDTVEILDKHTGPVTSVAISPNNKWILTGSQDATAILWDAKTLEYKKLLGHTKAITSVVFSPDSKFAATASQDTTIRIWDLENSTSSVLNYHQGAIDQIGWTPNGEYFVSISNPHTVKILNWKHLREVVKKQQMFAAAGQPIEQPAQARVAAAIVERAKNAERFEKTQNAPVVVPRQPTFPIYSNAPIIPQSSVIRPAYVPRADPSRGTFGNLILQSNVPSGIIYGTRVPESPQLITLPRSVLKPVHSNRYQYAPASSPAQPAWPAPPFKGYIGRSATGQPIIIPSNEETRSISPQTNEVPNQIIIDE